MKKVLCSLSYQGDQGIRRRTIVLFLRNCMLSRNRECCSAKKALFIQMLNITFFEPNELVCLLDDSAFNIPFVYRKKLVNRI